MNSAPLYGLLAKPGHELSKPLSLKVLDWLALHKLSVAVERVTAEALHLSESERVSIVERDELTQIASPIVILGGDGTLISASRHPAVKPPVIIGVNLGTLGFLTEITSEEILGILDLYRAGEAATVSRKLLKAEIMRAGAVEATYFSLNDVVLTKEAIARIFGVNLWVNRDHAALVRGDGVIVSTPVGSTAYSLSAGGSIVHPAVDALLVTPICPHSLTSRPLVLPGSSRIRLEVAHDAKHPDNRVFLTVDGQDGRELNVGDEVVITTSEHSVQFVRSPSRNYFQVLGTKLKWATM